MIYKTENKMKLDFVDNLFILLLFSTVKGFDVVVNTSLGNIRGYRLDVTSNNYVGSDVTHVDMFLGIPYAEPPIGNLRFSRPVSKAPWKPKEWNAQHVSSACPQPLWFLRQYSFGPTFSDIDEDCLYLNIYSPYTASSVNQHTSPLLPVMVWIHGGSYKYGSGAEYDGRVLAQEGVVVVTLNYRVGVLGFLSTDDGHVPGNYGLLDQLMALEWVKHNIVRFRGNPDKITIFGQSAGGGSVSLHMFSPKAKGLFQSAIPQSGCALSPWAIYRAPHKIRTYTVKLARQLGCSTATSADVIMCLRRKSVSDLVNTNVGSPSMISTFAPRVDGYYITDLPEVLLQRGEYMKDVQVMTGYVPQEVSEDLEGEAGIDNGLTRSHLESMFSQKSSRYIDNANDMYRAMLCAYPPSATDFNLNREYAIDMNSDYGYVAPHIKMAEMMSKMGTRVWLYDFTFRSPLATTKQWIGVPHAAELYYEFGAPFLRRVPCPYPEACPATTTWGTYQPWGTPEESVSRQIMDIWANFAKLGQGVNSFQIPVNGGLTWKPFTGQHEVLLNITLKTKQEILIKSRGIEFWDSYNYLNISAPVPDVCGTAKPIG